MPDETTSQDHSDPVIEHSPLEREVTRDDRTVRIYIYRGQEDPGWLLEIEDDQGGSTTWDDPFDSDQAALDEALRCIDEEGIDAFCDVETDPAAQRALWRLTMAEPEIAELRSMLTTYKEMSSFHFACGVFAAVISTPKFRAPSEWLELITKGQVIKDVTELHRFTNGVMALYNEVVRSVTELGAHCCPAPEDHDAVREFCQGYVQIASSEAEAFQDPRGLVPLTGICALAGTVSPETLAELAADRGETEAELLQSSRELLSNNVTALQAYWNAAREAEAQRLQQRALPHRRATPKVGRNERCPCGSGKKFKKCCAQ